MNKIYKFIAVISLLVIMPAISWYYLDTGLEFRKEARFAMEPKGNLDDLLNTKLLNPSFDLKTTCEGSTSLIIFRKDTKNDKTIEKLFKQFREAYTFQIVLVTQENLSPMSMMNEDNFHIIQTESVSEPMITLVDKELQIRNDYTFDKASIMDLVSHTALLLPRKAARDIKVQKNPG